MKEFPGGRMYEILNFSVIVPDCVLTEGGLSTNLNIDQQK